MIKINHILHDQIKESQDNFEMFLVINVVFVHHHPNVEHKIREYLFF